MQESFPIVENAKSLKTVVKRLAGSAFPIVMMLLLWRTVH
jgi:hypothetical protein